MSIGTRCLAADESEIEAQLKEFQKSSKKATTSTELIRICGEVFEIIDGAIAANDFPAASRAATMAIDLASKAGSKHWVYRAKARKDEVQTVTKEFKAISKSLKKLETAPDDPDANRKVGLFVAAMCSDWKRGSEMLGKSSDAVLNKISSGELAEPQEPAEKIALAAAWKEAAESEAPALKFRMHKRAYHWYQLAFGKVEGDDKKKFRDALSELTFFYLTDMEELDVGEGDWDLGKYGLAGNRDQTPITVDDIPYKRGLGMHPKGESKPFIVKYKLNGKYKTLQTGCGLNDDSKEYGGILTFAAIGDGRLLWKSGPIKKGSDIEFATVNIKGVQTLEIRTEGTAGPQGGHAVWLDPFISK